VYIILKISKNGLEISFLTSMSPYALASDCGRWESIVFAATVGDSCYLSAPEAMLLHIH